MKPARFRYIAARSLEEALTEKAKHGDEARFLAGGQSLVPAMNYRLVQPAVVIDINPLTQLSAVESDGENVRISALTRYRDLERHSAVARGLPLVREALSYVAHPQIRNRGTLCGNLAHADPASEMPAVMLALSAKLHVQSVNGDRWMAASDFFISPLTTALTPEEMLVEVELPAAKPRSGSSFMEVARRRGDFALMGIGCTVRLDESGLCVEARLAFCNAGDTPIFAADASKSLVGTRMGTRDLDTAIELVNSAIDPAGNLHASKEFQRHLAGVLTRRAIAQANERARHGH
jgi:CO/xanthine dehydrogenase FAD-binding subunit